jgi:hypothetical protein
MEKQLLRHFSRGMDSAKASIQTSYGFVSQEQMSELLLLRDSTRQQKSVCTTDNNSPYKSCRPRGGLEV